jgi:2,3-dihydroxybenzoate decarboxylase
MKFDVPNLHQSWKIALEEHFAIEATLGASQAYASAGATAWKKLSSNLLDMHNQRIEQMDKTGIDISIVSLNSPAIQAICDKQLAIDTARRSNDVLAAAVVKNPKRLRAFAALPMQDSEAAIAELDRCIHELGFVGALINGYSQLNDPETSLYLDIPQYRSFWSNVSRLEVPVYLHPREPLQSQRKPYDGHPWLLGASWAFGVETATHALRLICSGLFDEYPNIKIILGHLGEMLPYAIWRAEHRTKIDPRGLSLKKDLSLYFYENFYITTSGNFRTQALINCILEMGSDRILYSTDYPFESMEECDEWFSGVDISLADQLKIGRLNSLNLFKLDSPL